MYIVGLPGIPLRMRQGQIYSRWGPGAQVYGVYRWEIVKAVGIRKCSIEFQ